ncbi:diguanylate phosphodiesterase, partial [Acinetobacter sp. RIT592]
MLKKISNILVILIVLIPIIDNNIYSQEKPYKNKVIKVGFYDYNPYFYIDKGNPTGYYNDILDTICNDLGIEYEYKYTNILQAMSMLKNGDLDLLIGINRTEDRVNEFEFTDS